ncbi:MAG TPA: phosphatase PAP2 family protein [Mycobacteriales bacterium]|jgi:membrane-associated phospholipid phosphatase
MAGSSVEADERSAADEAHERRWRTIRRRAVVGYALVLVIFIVTVGVPEDREGLLLWILAALGIRCLGRGWASFRRVLIDWLPFTAVLIAYDYTRGIADNLGIATHVIEPAHADMWLFHGVLPTYWLQQHLFVPGHPRWYDAVVTLVYTSHFLVTPIAAVILWVRNRQRWVGFITRIIVLSLAGLLTYVLYPMAPPWYAARAGLIEPVRRISSVGWQVLGLNHAGSVLAGAQASVNAVAAMPSLHTATATLIALYFIPRAPWWGKILLACYPLLMGLALVYSGEHYVLDLLFGYVYAVVVMVVVGAGERWWAGRRRHRQTLSPGAVSQS